MKENRVRKFKLNTFQTIVLGFLSVIILGALLLLLPFSTAKGEKTSILGALFTSTSATCVTGLVVYDTATHWTIFGKVIILVLIQIGGLGVVTMAGFLALLSGRKIGLFERNTLEEALSAHKTEGIVRLTEFIISLSFLIEFLGAMVMAPVFVRDFGFGKGIWYSIFHSISAFCNAGFDLMGVREQYSSLTGYATNPVINLTIMALIIIGGIGFLTWDDVKTHGIHLKKYRMQSKVIFTVTMTLIVLPFLFFFFYEFSSNSLKERVWLSLFQAITPRTAGFNTADHSLMSEPGKVVTIALMLVGGSPGSTAGGLKTTTIAVLVLSAFAVFKRNDDTECFGRRVTEEAVRASGVLFFLYLFLSISSAVVISMIEGLPFLSSLFETMSAIATVGLSLGLTPSLGGVSRCILMVLMFFGRVGGLTLIYSAVSRSGGYSKLPQERITVG